VNDLKQRYICRFCEKSFIREDRYIAHQCKQMRRDDEVRTPTGQAAFVFYQDWMKSHRRTAPSVEAFLTSRYYNSFMKFAKYVLDVQIPDIELFIWLMREKDIPPTIWTNDTVYTLYIEFLDRKSTPIHQTNITINTLFELADIYKTDVGSVFKVAHPIEVIGLLRKRKLSPWVLLHSLEFKNFYKDRTTPEQKIILDNIIRREYWAEKLKMHPNEISKIKEMVRELSL
jgi:hypothetical protein